MGENAVKYKSEEFAVRIVHACRYLADEKKEYVISRQLLRSGTSIGANVSEAQYGSSRGDFVNKLYIALKETSETLYWLRLLFEGGYFTEREYSSLYRDCEEIRRILSAITKTVRNRND